MNKSVINPSKVGLRYMKKGNYMNFDGGNDSCLGSEAEQEMMDTSKSRLKRTVKNKPTFIGELN